MSLAAFVTPKPAWSAPTPDPAPSSPPPPNALDKDQLREILVAPQVIVSRRAVGELTTSWRAPLFMASHEIPAGLKLALIAVEDRRFLDRTRHFDVVAIGRAIKDKLIHGRTEGASTLQQQLLKNLLLDGLPRTRRKFEEIFGAIGSLLNESCSKDEILAAYLNWVPFQRGITGVEAAARAYFGKHAGELNEYECAALVGMLKNPSRFHPLREPGNSRARVAEVLALQVAQGVMTKERASAALTKGSKRGTLPLAKFGLGYFFDDFVRPALANLPGHGPWRIFLTLDTQRQLFAQAAIETGIRQGELSGVEQGVLVAIDASGNVRCCVGGRDYEKSQLSRATKMVRDAGSTGKVFTYLAAAEAGYKLGMVIADQPVTAEGWPHNFDLVYKGDISIKEAFAQSRNAATVQLAKRVKLSNVVAVANRFGITLPGNVGLEVALGNFGVTPLQLARVYGSFANGGRRVESRGVIAVLGTGSDVVKWWSPAVGNIIVQPQYLRLMRELLGAVVKSGTGHSAAGPVRVIGKTGTTGSYRDAWFAGIAEGGTAETVVVWFGNDAFKAMAGVTGGSIPATTFRQYITNVAALDRRRKATVKTEKPAPNAAPRPATPTVRPGKTSVPLPVPRPGKIYQKTPPRPVVK